MQLHDLPEVIRWLREHVSGTLCTDSRQVRPGDAFIAWPGASTDGRHFVNQALQAGASACLVEHEGLADFVFQGAAVASYRGLKAATGEIAAEFLGHPSRQLALLAVTGTNGKTSTAWWLAQALSALPEHCAWPCAMIGTLGVGRPPAAGQPAQAAHGVVTPTGLTTPDPVVLQNTLRTFVSQGLKACAMEASSIGIEEGRLAGTSIQVAIFTNFTQDHLDYHGSMKAYWQAKRRLFQWPGLQAAVINIDDPFGRKLAAELQSPNRNGSGQGLGLDVWTTSSAPDAAGGGSSTAPDTGALHVSQQASHQASQPARLVARNIHYQANGICFTVCEGEQALELQTSLIGSYNVANLLGVLATLRSLGVRLRDAVQACTALHSVPGRMECLGGAGQPMVAVDYAHTPDALLQVLRALRPLAQQREGRLWCVFGCGGDRDPGKRPQMGAIAQREADAVVVTSDNPRSESPEAIMAQILKGMATQASVRTEPDRARAIAHTIARAAAQDVVLIAGKGHEETQEIAGVKLPFADTAHAAQALRMWRETTAAEVRA